MHSTMQFLSNEVEMFTVLITWEHILSLDKNGARDLNSWAVKQNRLLLHKFSTINLHNFHRIISNIVEMETSFLTLLKNHIFDSTRLGKLRLICMFYTFWSMKTSSFAINYLEMNFQQ